MVKAGYSRSLTRRPPKANSVDITTSPAATASSPAELASAEPGSATGAATTTAQMSSIHIAIRLLLGPLAWTDVFSASPGGRTRIDGDGPERSGDMGSQS